MIKQDQLAASSTDIVQLLTINIYIVIRKLLSRIADLLIDKFN